VDDLASHLETPVPQTRQLHQSRQLLSVTNVTHECLLPGGALFQPDSGQRGAVPHHMPV